ncbi:uncharacterized protein LOC115564236 [Drosophila navojoa]|uniref:uncharacterized protein LOC115564236 n=1 Tax=Drosophila navojoa TaxID=7232 RepID=UPI0011BD8C7F|nr:uncharacterized protein LOC115564236 [Drosophila navojoa]
MDWWLRVAWLRCVVSVDLQPRRQAATQSKAHKQSINGNQHQSQREQLSQIGAAAAAVGQVKAATTTATVGAVACCCRYCRCVCHIIQSNSRVNAIATDAPDAVHRAATHVSPPASAWQQQFASALATSATSATAAQSVSQ